MTDTSSFDLPLGQIVIPNNRARSLDPVWAKALAALIRAQGLINSITVRRNDADDGWVLVSGMHRIAAYKILGSDEIPCSLSTATTDDEARLEEVMENLGRNELNALDRCHHLYELKQVYERVYPQTKHGGDRKSEKIKTAKVRLDNEGEEIQVFGFVKATAEQIGLSESIIQRAVKIWVGLSTESQFRLQGTRFAEKQSELRLMSDQKMSVQTQVLDLILNEDAPQTTVQDALDHLNKVQVPSDRERRYQVVSTGLSKLIDPEFDRLILENEERVIATLKRQGRI